VPPLRVEKKRFQTGYNPLLSDFMERCEEMARDGTARGGPRAGSGRKSKALTEKMETGNPGGRKLKVMELPDTPDLKGEDVPDPKDYLSAKQKNGSPLCADEVFKETWLWLKERGCEKLVSTQLIEQYAMSVARWLQCEQAISDYGFLAKHPTTGAACASPYVAMSQQYMKQVNQVWFQIFQIVKENCSVEFQGTPQDDMMERLLRSRKG
jgi:hypothetical protein